MDAREAREHLEMVDRILAKADEEPVRMVPGLIVAWGIAAAVIDAGQQLDVSHIGGNAGLWAAYAALAFGVLYSVVTSVAMMRGDCYERMSVLERRMGTTIGAVWFTVLVAAFAQPHVFAGWGGAAVWSMGAAIMMLMIGFDGDRRGLFGGLILLASVLAANYLFPLTAGYALAAGFILGYAIPGVLFLIDRPRGQA
jgi:hypothetical protein